MDNIELRLKLLKICCDSNAKLVRSALSALDILVALYRWLNISKENVTNLDRDRLVLSKGHAAAALYVVLNRLGIIDDHYLYNYLRKPECLGSHPHFNPTLGIDAASGSLGMGLSMAVGYSMANRLKRTPHRVAVVLGDGELNEGQVWEAFMAGAKYCDHSLVVVVDWNRKQHDGECEKIMPQLQLTDKFNSFGWEAMTCDGHSLISLAETLERTHSKNKPCVILARTTMGFGVKSLEQASRNFPMKPADFNRLKRELFKRTEHEL